MPQILPDDDIAKGINSLNPKQREVHTWAKDYAKCDENDVEPVHIFPSSSGGAGKSHLVKITCNTKSKTFFHHF